MNSKSLLIVAHGSRKQRSNDAVWQMAAQVAELVGERFSFVDCAFLELAEPSIEGGIDRCVTKGASEVIVMPYFLAPGRHVTGDVPSIVANKQAEYPQVAIRLGTYLGAVPSMAGLILETALTDHCLCGKARDVCSYPTCLQD